MSTPLVLDGRVLAREIEEDLVARVRALAGKGANIPLLATIIVGNDPASVAYVRAKQNTCARVGIGSRKVELPSESTTGDVIAAIRVLNDDDEIFGILLQHPVSRHIDEQECFNAINPEKDVDGVCSASFGAVSMGREAFKSATSAAILALLARYGVKIAGKEVCVVGRSPILGKPVSMLLLNADATVTICHSKTENLPEIIKRADIVVAAVGKPKFLKADWVKPGAVLIDAGYNPGNIGDIDLENAAPKSSAYTPVPGGVGPVTIATLISQTVKAAEKKAGL